MSQRHLLLLVLVAATAACSRSAPTAHHDDPPAQQEVATQAATVAIDSAQANTIYQERCSACHGASGHGDGPGAAALTPKPRNYTDKTWQAAVTDEQIKKTIQYGGAAVGKSAAMPANPDLEQKPEVVDGLVKIVRGFGS